MFQDLDPLLHSQVRLAVLSVLIGVKKAEFSFLIHQINQFPEKGDYIGNNCYKIRLAISSKGKGKSGGARVISYVYYLKETVYLLTVYDKNEKSGLKPNELKEMIENLVLD